MSKPIFLRIAVLVSVFLAGSPLFASHFRGGNVSVSVTEAGLASFSYETLWRKGSADFPFAGVSSISFYATTDVNRSFTLATVSVSIGGTTTFRDVSDPAFDFRRQKVDVDLVSLGLSQGDYIARWTSCCRIAGLHNAPESSFSLETVVRFDGTANGSPVLNSSILTVVGKGLAYDQNLNAFDPDNSALSYQFLVGAFNPDFGPFFNIPGITLDATGQVFISPFDTAVLNDINTRNPAGDYVFKVRVIDATGIYSERDVLLDVVSTANQAPVLKPIPNRVIEVGELLVLPISATDPNVVDRVTLRTSALPDNAIFVQSPGNPASGSFAFRPDATQVGTFGINFEASDNGIPILTDSDLAVITVLDPANECPVLAPIGNRGADVGVPLSFVVTATDPDPGQTLSFSASFLPPGASFDPGTATFSWTPTAAEIGVHLGTVFEVADSAAPPCVDRETVGFAVQAGNNFPELDPVGDRTVTEGAMTLFTISASDPDFDAVSFSANPVPLGAAFDQVTGEFMWQPTIGQAGIYEITFSATDDGTPSLTDSEIVRVTVAPSGEEPIRFQGIVDQQVVSGTILVEAEVFLPFPVQYVDFDIDGQVINRDTEAPYVLGGETGGMPLGFDTTTLPEGLAVISATAVDDAGQMTTAQIKMIVKNIDPPVLDGVDGVIDGGVVSGIIFIQALAIDDQQVETVEFQIDEASINTETMAPYFLNGTTLPSGTYDVSCTTCLQIGDVSGDLVVVDVLDPSGTLDMLCVDDDSDSDDGSDSDDSDSDSDSDNNENSDDDSGVDSDDDSENDDDSNSDSGSDDDSDSDSDDDSDSDSDGGGSGGSCITSLSLGVASDPSMFATFGPEDFTGDLTTFFLPFAVPIGFDTTTLSDGLHTITIIITDNTGLTTTTDIQIFVRNVLPPDALQISITSPTEGETFREGRIVPVTADVASAQGPVAVTFIVDGKVVGQDISPPFVSTVLVPARGAAVVLDVVATDDRGPWQATPVAIGVSQLPPPLPSPIVATDFSADRVRDGLVAVDSALSITYSGSVDGASLGGITISSMGVEVGLATALDPSDDRTVVVTPVAPLEPDTLYAVTAEGVTSVEGAVAPRLASFFLTFPDVAIVAGQVLDSMNQPIAGMGVRVGAVAGTTNASGVFLLEGVPTGPQMLEIAGGVIAGLTYPPLEFEIDITPGIDENGIGEPVFLPALDLASGLDVVGGTATGSGILTAGTLPGMAIDLNGISVLNDDGTPFTGRMSITTVPPPNVPMEGLPDFASDTYITVQPPRLSLVPPAPITYPNTGGALPGEQIPLSHFDHDINDWFIYGNGTVSADASSITSNLGEGLPETGWGCPHPPNTFTTVTGTAVDKEGNPLHGVRAAAGSRRALTMNDGSFSIPMVPAGRQGSPRQITVQLTARDMIGGTYTKSSSPRTAVQNGTTAFGNVMFDDYAPVVNNRIVLHGDFSGATADHHVLKVGSSHSSEQRYRREVEEVQQRLADLGFRQGGSTTDPGQSLVADGDYGANSKKAVKLFQTLELFNGGNGQIGGDGEVGPSDRTINALNDVIANELWVDAGPGGGVDYGCPNEVADGWGTLDAGLFITGNLGGNGLFTAGINDLSNPSGGDHPDHRSHETGIDIDLVLKRLDNGGCPANPGWGRTTTGQTGVYDQDYARDILSAAQPFMILAYFGDAQLCNVEGLCTFAADHTDHMHVRLNPELIGGGVRSSGGGAPCVLVIPGGSAADVPVDAPVSVSFQEAFDPSTLNASTVLIDGPAGPVIGNVTAAANGHSVRFDPVSELSFATDYDLTITTGAVMADGTILAQPMVLPFTTESSPSIRAIDARPVEGENTLPLDTVVTVTFDQSVDPSTLTAQNVVLADSDSNTAVAIDLSLLDGQRRLLIEPRQPLAEVTNYALSLFSGIQGVDGSSLVEANFVTTFATGLRSGLERVEISPAVITFTRTDLADQQLSVTGFFDDGTTEDLSDTGTKGTFYPLDRTDVVTVDSGLVRPKGDGQAILQVLPLLEGFMEPVRIFVNDVFPDIDFVGRQFSLLPDGNAVIGFSEPIDAPPLAIANLEVEDENGNPVAGATSVSVDGLAVTFDPDFDLPAATDFQLRFDLEITDGMAVTRPFPQRIPFATSAANLGFELGDLTGFTAAGDVEVIQSLGPLTAPEGDYQAQLITSHQGPGGTVSRLQTVDLEVPAGATSLVFTYNFLTDEIDQGSTFDDFFRGTLVLADGTELTIVEVSRNDLGGQFSPVPGYDRMTGYQSASISLIGLPGGSCDLVFEVIVDDVGDSSIDSAVLIDDIRFE